VSHACGSTPLSLAVSIRVDAFVFQGRPEPLDEDVFEETAFAVHRDAHARASPPVGNRLFYLQKKDEGSLNRLGASCPTGSDFKPYYS